jgi:hypothetical protein
MTLLQESAFTVAFGMKRTCLLALQMSANGNPGSAVSVAGANRRDRRDDRRPKKKKKKPTEETVEKK